LYGAIWNLEIIVSSIVESAAKTMDCISKTCLGVNVDSVLSIPENADTDLGYVDSLDKN